MTFKAAYVRQTIDHEVIASSVYGFAALALLPIFFKYETNKVFRSVAGTAVAIMLLVLLPISLPLELPLLARYPLLVGFNFFQVGVRTGPCLAYLGGSKTFEENFKKRMQKIKDENELPALEGAVDIYPVMSNVAIAHEFDYRPRPVFQSYLAYTQPLTKINKEHLASEKAAPTIVIQSLKDCYGYYPSLYDGPSWPSLLSQYEPVSTHPGGLVLKKRLRASNAVLNKIRTTAFKLGEPVVLEPSEKIIFAEIETKQTALGAVQKLFYRIFPPAIDVVLSDGSKKHFIAPSQILKSGFVMSPYVVSPAEFEKLYAANPGKSSLSGVKSVTISETKNELPWNVFYPDCQISLYELSITRDTEAP
ncbi:MAG: hypothetical protein SGJ27_07790 [Candidatus Melainabacteria bacterium]|nr:hypothetical protein [Candidatus Melainabacteria bacterium]